jgi:hypothetical protein
MSDASPDATGLSPEGYDRETPPGMPVRGPHHTLGESA